MKLGVSEEGTVLNECAKFQKKLPYGSRGCHWLQWHKNNNNKYSCRQQWRVPPKIANQGKIYILHNLSLYRKIHAVDLPMGYTIWNAILWRSTRALLSCQGESGALVRPQCHEMMCVPIAKGLVCQGKVCVCENWSKYVRGALQIKTRAFSFGTVADCLRLWNVTTNGRFLVQ